VEVTHLFSGVAVAKVDAKGRIRLPAFILGEMERQRDRGRLLFGVHESDPCLTGYGAALKPRLHAELERRRLREEEAGRSPAAHHDRARRLFGMVEEANYDDRGQIVLPPLARRRAGIAERVLLIGAGSHFELWDPSRALAEGTEEVRELARYGLEDEDREEESI
jgi:MraZ protein